VTSTRKSRSSQPGPPFCPSDSVRAAVVPQTTEGGEGETNEASCLGGGIGTGVGEGRERWSGSGCCVLVLWERVSETSPSPGLSDMSVGVVVSEDGTGNGGKAEKRHRTLGVRRDTSLLLSRSSLHLRGWPLTGRCKMLDRFCPDHILVTPPW